MSSDELNQDHMCWFANITLVVLYSFGACIGVCGCCAYAYYSKQDAENDIITPAVYIGNVTAVPCKKRADDKTSLNALSDIERQV